MSDSTAQITPSVIEDTAQKQEWQTTVTSLAGLEVKIDTPVHLIMSLGGKVDMAVASVSYAGGEEIVADIELQTADISNALVAAYQHVALGRALPENIYRSDALEHIVAAMKLININGANSIVSNTRDQGSFQLGDDTINWQRLVNGSQVVTNFNTVTVQSEDDSIQQGVWLTLTISIDNVVDAKTQYEAYARAYLGEGE